MNRLTATVTFTVDGQPMGDRQTVVCDTTERGTPRSMFLAGLVDVGRAALDEIPFELTQDGEDEAADTEPTEAQEALT